MPQPVHYICTKCDFRGSSFSTWGEHSYSVNNTVVPVKRKTAVCYTCNSIVSAEILPTTERIESFRNRSDEFKEMFPGVEREEKKEIARFEALLGRKSPARCLHCGSHDFDLMPEVIPNRANQQNRLLVRTGLFHRNCGGRIYADFRAPSYYMGDKLPKKFFDIEGLEIKNVSV